MFWDGLATDIFFSGIGDSWLTFTYEIDSRSTFGIQEFAAVSLDDVRQMIGDE